MANRKHREITVADVKYGWHVSSLNQSYVVLKVWLAEHRNHRPLRVRFRFDDPWLHFAESLAANSSKAEPNLQTKPIKPYAVRNAIQAAARLGWQPDAPARPFDIAWISQEFVRVKDATEIPTGSCEAGDRDNHQPPAKKLSPDQ